MWGTEWPKFNRTIQGKYLLGTMTFNSLTENEEHDIPSQILKTIFGFHASYFYTQYVWLPVHLYCPVLPISSDQLAEPIVILFHQSKSL